MQDGENLIMMRDDENKRKKLMKNKYIMRMKIRNKTKSKNKRRNDFEPQKIEKKKYLRAERSGRKKREQ